MGLMNLCLLLLLLATAAVPHSASYYDDNSWPVPFHGADSFFGAMGGFFGDDEGDMFSNPTDARRHLQRASSNYLSYSALRRNKTPCGRRGRSYYNCRKRQRNNPYQRGCTTITRCARVTD